MTLGDKLFATTSPKRICRTVQDAYVELQATEIGNKGKHASGIIWEPIGKARGESDKTQRR